MRLFILRHQHGGRLTQYAFANEPTDEQMESVGSAADTLYGPGWLRVDEIEVITGNSVPMFGTSETQSVESKTETGIAYTSKIVGSGVGEVINPSDFEG